jgi:hypothetical protein
MVQMTIQLSDELADRVRPIGPWLSTVIEISLTGFKTPAAATAAEVMQVLLNNPAPQELFDYHVSDQAQARLQRLLVLGEAGMLSELEQLELDELQRLEHTIIMLKAQIAKQLQQEP